MNLLYPIGTNWRNGKDRVSYRPDWDEKNPFITYSHGTAKSHRGTLLGAILDLGYRQVKMSDWVRT